jgi:hypothetical protein
VVCVVQVSIFCTFLLLIHLTRWFYCAWGGGAHTPAMAGQGRFHKNFLFEHTSQLNKRQQTQQKKKKKKRWSWPQTCIDLLGIVFILSGQIQKKLYSNCFDPVPFLISWPRTFRWWIFYRGPSHLGLRDRPLHFLSCVSS